MGFLDNKIDLPDGENLAPDPKRVSAIQDMLIPGFRHLGRPGSDRSAWEPVRTSPIGQRIIGEARRSLSLKPRPMVTDELYQFCLAQEGQAEFRVVAKEQRIRMGVVPVTLCIDPEMDGLGTIKQDLGDLIELTTWIHPANDDQGQAFAGKVPFNDLCSLHNATNAVAARYLMGDRLGSDLCTRIEEETKRRVLKPFRERIESGKDVYWWICHDNNWNSVCLASTLSCALALCEDLEERAWYVAVVEAQIRNSIRGFSESGFYTEGVGYWGYGFGHFVLAAEMVRAATGGELDWMAEEKVERTAHFGSRMVIQDGIRPSFADCRSDARREVWLENWLNNRVDPQRKERSTSEPVDTLEGFRFQFPPALLLVCLYQEYPAFRLGDRDPPGLREWYGDVQFLISRPRSGNSVRMAATFKGGHNGVSHNHNDLGTFTVQIDDQELLVDPGAELYTGRTFGPKRYESNLLNSYGHPVPVVAGQFQSPDRLEFSPGFGSEFHATIVDTRFSEEIDQVVLDLAKAYRVESLTKLERTFGYFRSGGGRVEISDRVVFSQPEAFETALITYADWRYQADGSVTISSAGRSISVRVASDDGELQFSDTVIRESSTPVRLAWAFSGPVLRAKIRIEIRPC